MIKTINPQHSSAAAIPQLGDLTRPEHLPDHLLDYAVAAAEGFEIRHWPELGEQYWRLYLQGAPIAYVGVFNIKNLRAVRGVEHYSPSRNPLYSTEIITRERIGTHFDVESRQWVARECGNAAQPWGVAGPTPSIAALRCYVAARARKGPRTATTE